MLELVNKTRRLNLNMPPSSMNKMEDSALVYTISKVKVGRYQENNVQF